MKKNRNIYAVKYIQDLENVYCTSRSAIVSQAGLSCGSASLSTRIINGGKKILYTAAMTGMLINNIAPQAFAETTTVVAGDTSNGLIANNGDTIKVYGTTNNTIVNSNGKEIIYTTGLTNSGIANNTIVNSGGDQIVSGGVAYNTQIKLGGTQHVSYGGRAVSAVVSGGGVQFVKGIAQNTTLQKGWQEIESNGSAYNTIIQDNGLQHIYSGGQAFYTTISSGAQGIASAGLATFTNIQQGTQIILSGGSATLTSVYAGGSQVINSSGRASYTTLEGGTQIISDGGIATSTVLNSGNLNISLGGSAINVVQNSGNINADIVGGLTNNTYVSGINQSGVDFSLANGVADNFILNENGTQNISNGGVANNTELNSGGVQYISTGGTANSTTINNGGTQTISHGLATSTIVNNGGTQNILNGGTANYVSNNGTVNLSGGILSNYTANTGSLYVYDNNVYILNGTTNLGAGTLTFANNTSGMVVAQNLSANNAVISMGVNLENQTSDQLVINNSYEGSAKLKLRNTGSIATETSEQGIKLIDISNTATVNGTFELLGGKWDEGGYVYKLFQDSGDPDYYLRSTDEYSDTFKTMANVPILNVAMVKAGMNSLNKRMGDLRDMNNPAKKQGVWARTYYKNMTVDDLTKTDMSLFGVEMGYDWLFRADEPTKLYAGVMLGYMNANSIKTKNSNDDNNDGNGEAPSVGIYATIANENGWFIDLAARNFWSKIENTTHTSSDTLLKFDTKRNLLTASLEVGKTFKIDNGFKVEPKVEVSYMNANADSTEVENGTGKLEYDAANYINGKAAIMFAYKKEMANQMLIEPLLELAYNNEFTGKDKVRYGGAEDETSLKGGSFEVNAGLSMQLADNLYWHALASYEKGSKLSGWGVNAGVRLGFGGGNSVKNNRNKI